MSETKPKRSDFFVAIGKDSRVAHLPTEYPHKKFKTTRWLKLLDAFFPSQTIADDT